MTFATIIVNHGTSKIENQKEAIDFLRKKVKEKYKNSLVKSYMASDRIRKKVEDKKLCQDLEEILNECRKKNIKDIRFLMAYVLRGIEYEKVMEKSNQLNKDGFFNFTFTKALLEEENNDEILDFLEELGENNPSLVIFHGSPRKNLEEFEKFQEKIKKSDKNLYFSSFEDRKFDDLIGEFKEKNIEKLKVIPFLIIVGNHVDKDIEGEKENSYKKVFEKNKIEINILKKSLILYNKIAEIFVEKLEK